MSSPSSSSASPAPPSAYAATGRVAGGEDHVSKPRAGTSVPISRTQSWPEVDGGSKLVSFDSQRG